ncbi:MAG TPA: hypothetical protein VFI06_06575 [Chitinophagaceae bacterium]|nr:hypothetical protein [Chitinophagaceae bacterium]
MFITVTSFSQDKFSYNDKKKGQLAISWGWNRGAYTNSNISFKGNDYDFKLYHVKAHDVPTSMGSLYKYLQVTKLTIPQTDLRISYFLKDNLAISFGDDHMKYVMTQDQTVRMKGNITRSGNYEGVYDGNMTMTTDFLTFEHTDGLNYLNLELEKYFTWYHSKSGWCIISSMTGIGAGVLFPKTNVKLLDYARNDRFHISGFGTSVKMGLQGTFFKHFIIKAENKYGYINMPDIILHKKGIAGRAKQQFFFTEAYITAGVSFALCHKRKSKSNQ